MFSSHRRLPNWRIIVIRLIFYSNVFGVFALRRSWGHRVPNYWNNLNHPKGLVWAQKKRPPTDLSVVMYDCSQESRTNRQTIHLHRGRKRARCKKMGLECDAR